MKVVLIVVKISIVALIVFAFLWQISGGICPVP